MLNWKTLPKIDAHIHITPDDVIEANKDYDGKFIINGASKDYIKLMDKYNIKSAFVMPFNDPYMLSMEFTVEAVHNNLLKIADKHKGKIFCFADIDIRKDISETLSEFDRVFKSEAFIGIKLHPTNSGYPIDGHYYEEIFKYADKKNILLEIHSYPRESLKDDVCSPARIKNMLEKYPNVRVSVAHLGGFQYAELIDTNTYVNISAILTDLVERCNLEETNKILRSFGVDRLVFATDYPDNRRLEAKVIYDKYIELLGMMDFTEEEAEKICMFNAEKMIQKL
jgi:predicted TIM-barrel fold metal-dependent hydrolase